MVTPEHWNEVCDGALSETSLRRKLEVRAYLVMQFRCPPATRFPPHTHDCDKLDVVSLDGVRD